VFYDKNKPLESKKFDLITAFEVFEHVPDQHALVKDITSLMSDNSLLLFSTLLSDGNLKSWERPDWWYASPRNGHISLHSRKSLETLLKSHDLTFVNLYDDVHIAYKNMPSWLPGLNLYEHRPEHFAQPFVP
jgi:predicted TPR repeat methyltransferase